MHSIQVIRALQTGGSGSNCQIEERKPRPKEDAPVTFPATQPSLKYTREKQTKHTSLTWQKVEKRFPPSNSALGLTLSNRLAYKQQCKSDLWEHQHAKILHSVDDQNRSQDHVVNGHGDAQGNLRLCRITFRTKEHISAYSGPLLVLFTSYELRVTACGVGDSEECKESVIILGLVVHVPRRHNDSNFHLVDQVQLGAFQLDAHLGLLLVGT